MTLPRHFESGRVPRSRRFNPDCASPWQSHEDTILREHFPLGGCPACEPLLPDRTRVGIRRRAARLGLDNGFVPRSPLTEHQRAALEAVVVDETKVSAPQLAERLNLTERAVRKQLRKIRDRLVMAANSQEQLDEQMA